MTARERTYLLDMLAEVRNLADFTEGMERYELDENLRAQYAIVRSLTIFGEAASRMSRETREQHSAIPWSAIIGMRNILVHDYGHIDTDEVWRSATVDIPSIRPVLEKIEDEWDECTTPPVNDAPAARDTDSEADGAESRKGADA